MKNFRGGMGELMRQASRMQRKIEARREALKDETYEATMADDRVKVTVNGGAEVVRVELDPTVLEQEGLELLQDLIVAATNAALTKARESVDAEIDKITGGVKLPGMG
ncbi:MAG: YbaB/EbfC family nucleoid-associated protein [Myxococcales bacterium]|nr:YbaB/EbfC family nucleoid-associated protein [Myxococcales bacterium]